jgi:hypothetical protein
MALNQRALQLLDIAKTIGPEGHRATSRKGRVQYNKFVQAVYFIEKDWEKVKVAYKQRGGNPIKHVFFFCMGILSALLSLTWLLHIILYIFIDPPADQFLNKYFMDLDAFFALFGRAAHHAVHCTAHGTDGMHGTVHGTARCTAALRGASKVARPCIQPYP